MAGDIIEPEGLSVEGSPGDNPAAGFPIIGDEAVHRERSGGKGPRCSPCSGRVMRAVSVQASTHRLTIGGRVLGE